MAPCPCVCHVVAGPVLGPVGPGRLSSARAGRPGCGVACALTQEGHRYSEIAVISMLTQLQSREIGAPNDVRSAIVRAQQYAARVMRALIRSLRRLITLETQGNVVAAYMRRLNERAQERLYKRSRPFVTKAPWTRRVIRYEKRPTRRVTTLQYGVGSEGVGSRDTI